MRVRAEVRICGVVFCAYVACAVCRLPCVGRSGDARQVTVASKSSQQCNCAWAIDSAFTERMWTRLTRSSAAAGGCVVAAGAPTRAGAGRRMEWWSSAWRRDEANDSSSQRRIKANKCGQETAVSEVAGKHAENYEYAGCRGREGGTRQVCDFGAVS